MSSSKIIMISISVGAVALGLYCLYKINKLEGNIGLIFNKITKLELNNNPNMENFKNNQINENQNFKNTPSFNVGNNLNEKENEINELKKEISQMENLVNESDSDSNYESDNSIDELSEKNSLQITPGELSEIQNDNMNHEDKVSNNLENSNLEDEGIKVEVDKDEVEVDEVEGDEVEGDEVSVDEVSVDKENSIDKKNKINLDLHLENNEEENFIYKELNISDSKKDTNLENEINTLIENHNKSPNKSLNSSEYKESNIKSEFDELDNSETDMNSELGKILEQENKRNDSESQITKDILLQKYTKNQLKDLCSHYNLQVSGNKTQLLNRLIENNISLEDSNNKPTVNISSQI